MTTNITQDHKTFFDALTAGWCDDVCLVSTTFDGEPTAAIAQSTRDGDSFIVKPILVFMTDSMFERLTDPGEGLKKEEGDGCDCGCHEEEARTDEGGCGCGCEGGDSDG